MKYILILCFLLSFAISILPDYFTITEGSCTAESKEKCVAIKLEENDTQCCYLSMSSYNETKEECTSMPNHLPLTELSNLMKAPQFKPLTKEVFGFLQYSSSMPIPIPSIPEGKGQITCQEGGLDIDIWGDKYSDEDIKILKSENYCLNYTISTIMQKGRTADCKNAKFLQSSKDAGIECGNLSIKLKSGGSEISMQTCMLFSFDMFSKITLSDENKEMLSKYIKENMNNMDKATIELSDSKGRKFTFDTDAGIIIDDNSNASNYSSILNISKYLLILILFLF